MKWIDVSPYDWFYRDILDADNVRLEPNSNKGLVSSMAYNQFDPKKKRYVKSFMSFENQIAFPVEGYVPNVENPLLLYVSGVPIEPAHVTLRVPPGQPASDGVYEAFLPTPITGGIEVIAVALGKPLLVKADSDEKKPGYCRDVPIFYGNTKFPSVELRYKTDYVFDLTKYRETCIGLGKSLKRINLDMHPGESVQDVMKQQVHLDPACFTIVDGVLYTSYDYNEIPCLVTYCYEDNGVIRTFTEKVIPKSDVILYNDRVFPNVYISRADFMILLQRIRKNLYLRFTDREYHTLVNNERNIPDIVTGSWYEDDLYDILNEKYLDGCYVFPLYEDGSFIPEGCITRAECATYLNRFIEWTAERFR